MRFPAGSFRKGRTLWWKSVPRYTAIMPAWSPCLRQITGSIWAVGNAITIRTGLPPITITATVPYALSPTGRICIISSTVRAGPILRRKCWSAGLQRISMRSLPGCKTAFSGSLKRSGKSCSPGSPSSRPKAIYGTRNFTRKDRPAIIICWTAG